MKEKVIITGTCGFIGSNLIRKAIYEKLPYDFVSIDRVNMNTLNSLYWNKNHTFHIADIRDPHIIDVIFQFEKPDIVMNLAASTHVDESLTDPNTFVTNNVLGTQNLINASIKHNVKRFIQISCYDKMTRAVTKSGFKEYHELKEGDLVLSINPKTGSIEEKPIKKIIIQDYNGDLLHFNNRRVDLAVTPNHRIICSKLLRDNGKNLQWYTAEDFEKLDNKYYFPIGQVNLHSPETIDVPFVGNVNAKAFFYLCGIFIGDGFTAYQKKLIKNISGYSKDDYSKKCRDPKTGRFLKTTEKQGVKEFSELNSYRIFIDVPQNDKARKPLEEALKKLNIKYTSQNGKGGEHIYFTSKQWMNFFNTCGKYAKNKQIPEWMFNYGIDLLKSLWQGLHDSDGHGYGIKSNTCITTISSKLTAQLCYLGSMIGYQTKVDKRHSLSYMNGRKIEGDAYRIYFSNIVLPLIPKPTRYHYNDKIWCLKVEDNKNFLVERNGHIAYCGNTDEVLGQLTSEQDPPWTEESPLDPRNPYSASKASAELMVKAAHYSHGLTYNISRSSNNYGPRQDCSKLLPKVIKHIMQDKPIPIYGQGLQIRDWTHVFDNCSALLKILTDGKPNEIYNISANQEYTNIEVVQKICNVMGKGHNLIEFIKDPRVAHDYRYSLDCSKIKELGWEPKIKFVEGIQQCVSWYQANSWFIK